ncbi:magnesium transporter [Haematococcus lacustris]|uniref:Magnesium transporter n=1 Tax=Haematococcus lacustris TaxID=44745 RepID=A0A6A0AD57_HAELA|nr:magnesium transporter [Haematococcus lacustris]
MSNPSSACAYTLGLQSQCRCPQLAIWAPCFPGEYIDDTEDLVNINLDYSRNRLIRFQILITIATFALGCYSCIASVLGENLVLPEVITQDVLLFFMVNGVAIICSCSVFMLIVLMLRLKKLI